MASFGTNSHVPVVSHFKMQLECRKFGEWGQTLKDLPWFTECRGLAQMFEETLKYQINEYARTSNGPSVFFQVRTLWQETGESIWEQRISGSWETTLWTTSVPGTTTQTGTTHTLNTISQTSWIFGNEKCLHNLWCKHAKSYMQRQFSSQDAAYSHPPEFPSERRSSHRRHTHKPPGQKKVNVTMWDARR